MPPLPVWYRAAWRKAGLSSDRLHEAHGSIHHLQCTSPGACSAGRWVPKVRRWEPSGGRIPVDESSLRVAESELPRCPHGCGALARPNVYMFDDDRWVGHRADEQVGKGHPEPRVYSDMCNAIWPSCIVQECRLDKWLLGVTEAGQRLVVIDIGSGTAIPTARDMAESVALRGGGEVVTARAAAGGPRLSVTGLIRINPSDPQVPASELVGTEGPRTVGIAAGAKDALLRIAKELAALEG